MPRKTKDVENEVPTTTKKKTTKTKEVAKTSLPIKTTTKKNTKVAETKKVAEASSTAKKKTPAKKTTAETKKTAEVSSTAKKKTATKKATAETKKTAETSSTAKKKTATKKATAETKKTAEVSSTAKKKTATKKATAETKKTAEASSTVKKKTATKKATAETKKTAEASSTAKKKTIAGTKKTTKSVKAKKASPQKILEYYDLPYRYNETVVKILAQTPKKLFIYWDISDDHRKSYIDRFGNDFFNNTVPVLIVHNDSNNYSFEVQINDFANCWYLDINDTKCKYTIELGRRSRLRNYYIPNNYIYIASSNEIESPNDHILFEQQTQTVYFRNVKNNTTYSKDITNLSFIRKIDKIYSIYDAYKKLYNKIYNNEDLINGFNLNNPSSGNPTSTFK